MSKEVGTGISWATREEFQKTGLFWDGQQQLNRSQTDVFGNKWRNKGMGMVMERWRQNKKLIHDLEVDMKTKWRFRRSAMGPKECGAFL